MYFPKLSFKAFYSTYGQLALTYRFIISHMLGTLSCFLGEIQVKTKRLAGG